MTAEAGTKVIDVKSGGERSVASIQTDSWTSVMWDHPSSLAELARLLSPDVIGFYNCAEVTEIVAFRKGAPATNVLSIIVAEERSEEPDSEVRFLTPRPAFRIHGLTGWSFGIVRYHVPTSCLFKLVNECDETQGWTGSGSFLQLGTLTALQPTFVPPDSIYRVPLNGLLKNNFWNGSHLFEWANTTKADFKPFFDDSRLLQLLSEQVQKYVPIDLAALSDRLGNVIVQLPVQILQTRFVGMGTTGSVAVEMAWHPRATPRPVRISCEVREDRTIKAFGAASLQADQTPVPIHLPKGAYQSIVWDDTNNTILAATSESTFINTIGLSFSHALAEPRVFTIPLQTGTVSPQTIPVVGKEMTSFVGEHPDATPSWTERRIFRDRQTGLSEQRRFVQYRPDSSSSAEERKRALSDIRYLLQHHGQEAAWLWDPFLSANDVLETLFFCGHSGSDLRALTAAKTRKKVSKQTHLTAQGSILEANKGNCYGLRLEFRAMIGPGGWDFHDRFLIFPKTRQGAQAWSLGTSVNSAGTSHHILQEVADGELVMLAFIELWDNLNRVEHLVWKTP